MKMTKKVLTAMIAVSMAATALPAAAVIDDVASTLTSSNSLADNTVSTIETEGVETISTPDVSDSNTQSETDPEDDSQSADETSDENAEEYEIPYGEEETYYTE